MKPMDYWKNFGLGEELSVSGNFIYNGLRRFHEMRRLDYADEVFEVLYNLSVGLERLLKIAVVLLEHEPSTDQEALEQSLITHNHLELLARVRKRAKLNLGSEHNDFLQLLGRFYNSLRYDRFTLASVQDFNREKSALLAFLSKHLAAEFPQDTMFGTDNDEKYQKFVRKLVIKLSGELYGLIQDRAHVLNLYTYEVRHGSKAETVFLGKADIPAENVLWKELLIFFMNTKASTGTLKFLRGIEPLDFDPADANDFLLCFQSAADASLAIDQLETIYEDLPNKGERLRQMAIIGDPMVRLDDDDDDEDDEPFEPLADDSGLPDPFDPEPSK